MSGRSFLVDTNIILYLLNGDETLAELLLDKHVYISFVTELELLGYKGMSEQEQEIVKSFIRQCRVIDVNEEIKEETIRLRRIYNLLLPDALILATGIYLGLPLITADADFKKAEKEIELIHYLVDE